MWRYLSVIFVTLIPLAGCGQPDPRELPGKVEPSVVLITYGDKSGHGSGFFVEGEKDVCTILTAAHVVKTSGNVLIKTDDRDRSWPAETVREFPNNLDLALITFSTPEQKCPYTALPLGNSDELRVLDEVYTVGFPARSGEVRLVKQFSKVEISRVIDPFPDGYGISFTGTTAGGMSGGPLVDGWGKVVAIHGKTDVELVQINEQYQSSLSSEQQQELESAQARYQRSEHFKWGIPIRLYQEKAFSFVREQKYKESLSKEKSLRKAKEWNQKGNELSEQGKYKEALAFYEKAIEIKPDFFVAWWDRGFALNELGKYEEALKSYDKALEIKSDFYHAWWGRGFTLNDLKRYEEALESYDKALEIKPDYSLAWSGRGTTLEKLEKYEEALESYDKALEIEPNYFLAWANRGDVLRNLERYEEAIASYNKAIEFNPNSFWTWNARAIALKNLGRYQEALKSINKALELDPQNKLAQNNHAEILKKLSNKTLQFLFLITDLPKQSLTDSQQLILPNPDSLQDFPAIKPLPPLLTLHKDRPPASTSTPANNYRHSTESAHIARIDPVLPDRDES